MEGYSTQPFLLKLNSYKFHAPAAKVHSIRQRAFDRGWGGGGRTIFISDLYQIWSRGVMTKGSTSDLTIGTISLYYTLVAMHALHVCADPCCT